MRRHLVDPAGHAGVGVAREDGHRPLVVAGPLRRVPGAGVAGAVVDQVQVGIVGEPAPGGAAAEPPLVALPGRDGAVRADRLAHMRGALRVELDLLVRADRVGPPRLRAVAQVVGRDMAAHAVLAAGDADQHLVAEHHRRHGRGLALGGIAVLHLPQLVAGLGVERDQGGVGLAEDDLAVGVGRAAVDGVAAHHADDVRILLRLVAPDDLAGLVQVHGEDAVRERRVDVHHVADHQRAALVPAQHAGRELPGRAQVAHVVPVDLVELAVAPVGVVAGRHDPLVRVALQAQQFRVGGGASRAERQDGRSRHGKSFRHLVVPSIAGAALAVRLLQPVRQPRRRSG